MLCDVTGGTRTERALKEHEIPVRLEVLDASSFNADSRPPSSRSTGERMAARYWHTPSWRSRPIRCCSRSLISMISRSNRCDLSSNSTRARMESRCSLKIEPANITRQKNISLTITSQILNHSVAYLCPTAQSAHHHAKAQKIEITIANFLFPNQTTSRIGIE